MEGAFYSKIFGIGSEMNSKTIFFCLNIPSPKCSCNVLGTIFIIILEKEKQKFICRRNSTLLTKHVSKKIQISFFNWDYTCFVFCQYFFYYSNKTLLKLNIATVLYVKLAGF